MKFRITATSCDLRYDVGEHTNLKSNPNGSKSHKIGSII